MKKKVCIILLFLTLFSLKFSSVMAKTFKVVTDSKGQSTECARVGNKINMEKICAEGEACNTVSSVYFCTQFGLTYPNGTNCNVKANLSTACRAGIASLISSNSGKIFKNENLNPHRVVTGYDCGYNYYYYTTLLINTFLYDKCGIPSSGRISYDALKKNKVYGAAENVYNKVSNIKKDIIKFDTNELTFSPMNDGYEASVTLSGKNKNYIYEGDDKFQVLCTLTGDGVSFNKDKEEKTLTLNGKNIPYNIKIYSKNEIESNKITLSCQPQYKHKVTTYYDCKQKQDVVSGALEDATATGNKIEIKNAAPQVGTCDVELGKVINANSTNNEQRRKALIGLYNDFYGKGYNYPGLLEFDTPCCGDKCSEDNINCLSATTKSTVIHNPDATPLYCEVEMNLNPSESYFKYINNHVKIYSGELYFSVDDGKLLDGTIKQVCYNSEGNEVQPENIKKPTLPTVTLSNTILNGTLVGDKISYSMDPVYIKLNGERVTREECFNKGNCKLLGYGLLSSLNSNNDENKNNEGNEEIIFTIDDQTAKCEYSSTPQIIKNNKLQLEFRVIDTNYPFVKMDGSKRNTMTNWCGEKNGEISCASDNSIVKKYIKENTNSYNQKYNSSGTRVTGDGAKYKITLTPSLMNDIVKNYHDKLPYSDFNLECRDKTNLEICKDSTLDENKIYQTSELLTYLKDSGNLIINNSTKR